MYFVIFTFIFASTKKLKKERVWNYACFPSIGPIIGVCRLWETGTQAQPPPPPRPNSIWLNTQTTTRQPPNSTKAPMTAMKKAGCPGYHGTSVPKINVWMMYDRTACCFQRQPHCISLFSLHPLWHVLHHSKHT